MALLFLLLFTSLIALLLLVLERRIVIIRRPMLDRANDIQDRLLAQPRAQARADHIPQRRRHAHPVPAPNLRARPQIRAALEEQRGELVLELVRERAQDRRVRARELAALRADGADAHGARADVLAADDEERLAEVVHLDRARADAPAVDERRGAHGARDAVEHERLRVPVEEAVLGWRAGCRGRRGQREVHGGGRQPERLEDGVEGGDRRRRVFAVRRERDEVRLEGLFDTGACA